MFNLYVPAETEFILTICRVITKALDSRAPSGVLGFATPSLVTLHGLLVIGIFKVKENSASVLSISSLLSGCRVTVGLQLIDRICIEVARGKFNYCW